MPIQKLVPLQPDSGGLSPERHLFAKYDLGRTLHAQDELCRVEIESGDAAAFLNRDGGEFCAYLERKYRIESPHLQRERTTWEERSVKIRSPSQSAYGRDNSTLVDGAEVVFHVPIKGPAELIETWPNVIMMHRGHPEGVVRDGGVVLTYRAVEINGDVVRRRLEADLELIGQFLTYTWKGVSEWNSALSEKVRTRVEARRKRLEGLGAALGFPLRVRAEEEQLYGGTQAVRRKIVPPAVHEDPFLETAHYEQILTTLEHMVHVMERSPSAFSTMPEEQLRDQFLVLLNGIYEGDATGETFNFEGKTDILIRRAGRNLFIAECKFWKGAKAFSSTIDQLLGYTCWRDTKTALLLFNRNKNFSAVLKEISRTAPKHPNFVREEEGHSETRFQYVFHHRDDPQREILVTVLAFEIPT